MQNVNIVIQQFKNPVMKPGKTESQRRCQICVNTVFRFAVIRGCISIGTQDSFFAGLLFNVVQNLPDGNGALGTAVDSAPEGMPETFRLHQNG